MNIDEKKQILDELCYTYQIISHVRMLCIEKNLRAEAKDSKETTSARCRNR